MTTSELKEMMEHRLLLTKEQVAELIGVEPVTVEGLHRNGVLRGTHVGKVLRWKPEWVRAFVDKLEQDD